MYILFIRQHFDLTSPSVGGCTGQIFSCPLCVKAFDSGPDLELHVNIEHRDVLSPASPSSSTTSCPVCGITLHNESNVSVHFYKKWSTDSTYDIRCLQIYNFCKNVPGDACLEGSTSYSRGCVCYCLQFNLIIGCRLVASWKRFAVFLILFKNRKCSLILFIQLYCIYRYLSFCLQSQCISFYWHTFFNLFSNRFLIVFIRVMRRRDMSSPIFRPARRHNGKLSESRSRGSSRCFGPSTGWTIRGTSGSSRWQTCSVPSTRVSTQVILFFYYFTTTNRCFFLLLSCLNNMTTHLLIGSRS